MCDASDGFVIYYCKYENCGALISFPASAILYILIGEPDARSTTMIYRHLCAIFLQCISARVNLCIFCARTAEARACAHDPAHTHTRGRERPSNRFASYNNRPVRFDLNRPSILASFQLCYLCTHSNASRNARALESRHSFCCGLARCLVRTFIQSRARDDCIRDAGGFICYTIPIRPFKDWLQKKSLCIRCSFALVIEF